MQIFSKNQIGRIKRLAKQREKALGISHVMALDQEAKKLGFANWAMFERAAKNAIPRGPKFARTTEDMGLSFRVLSQFDAAPDFEAAVRAQLPVLCPEYVNGISALEYARDFIRVALSVERFKVSSRSFAYQEMRIYLPYAFERTGTNADTFIPVGRHYKPIGLTDRHTFVDYGNFQNLLLTIPEQEWAEKVNSLGGSSGFLYNDSNVPWNSRANAERYLRHLEAVIEIAKRYERGTSAKSLA